MVSYTGKVNIPLSPYAPDKLVSRDGFSRPVPRQPAHSPYSGWIWCLVTGFPPISAAASIYLFKPPYVIGSVPSESGHAIAYRWRSLPRVRWHRASSPQGNSSNGSRHFGGHHGSINGRLSFPTPTIGMGGYVQDKVYKMPYDRALEVIGYFDSVVTFAIWMSLVTSAVSVS